MAGLAAQLRYYFGPPPAKVRRIAPRNVLGCSSQKKISSSIPKSFHEQFSPKPVHFLGWGLTGFFVANEAGGDPRSGVRHEDKGRFSPRGGGEALGFCKLLPTFSFVVGSGLGTFLGWFGFDKGNKLLGLPPDPRFIRFLVAYGCAYVAGKGLARGIMHDCPAVLLNTEEGRMKMELANIILNKHSDDAYLVKVVKRHFFAEHLFDDLHQDQPLSRWHPRHSYIDSAFVERMKEAEATNSDDEARSISRETNANTTPFGDLMEDSLACILSSPGCNMERNNPREKTGTVLNRSEPRARRRCRRHHHRHADE